MPRTAHPMTAVSAALHDVRKAFDALVAEQARLRQHVQSLLQRSASRRTSTRGRPARAAMAHGGPKKRGRAFKFSSEQVGEFRKQVENGKSARSLAKELKVSVPTMYNTLKRSGWTGRRTRPPGRPTRPSRSSANSGPKKRGRAFKFSNEQAGEFRKQVEGGKTAVSLAKELKVSLPTMYNMLKRAGWKGRKAKAA